VTSQKAELSSSTVLGNERRMMIIEYLMKSDTKTAKISDLVDYICQKEGNESKRHRKSVYVSLIQTHIPRLKREGFITTERDEIYLKNVPSDVEKYISSEEVILWPHIYVTVSFLFLLASLVLNNGLGVVMSLVLLGLAIFQWVTKK